MPFKLDYRRQDPKPRPSWDWTFGCWLGIIVSSLILIYGFAYSGGERTVVVSIGTVLLGLGIAALIKGGPLMK
jgi:hypothetical protein